MTNRAQTTWEKLRTRCPSKKLILTAQLSSDIVRLNQYKIGCMGAPKTTARIAGLLYLIVVICGIFSLVYVPSKIIVWDNAALTFSNIIALENLFRLRIVVEIILYTAFFDFANRSL